MNPSFRPLHHPQSTRRLNVGKPDFVPRFPWAVFAVLAPGSWSGVGVTELLLNDNGTLQTIRASVAAGSGGKRFLHLKIAKP